MDADFHKNFYSDKQTLLATCANHTNKNAQVKTLTITLNGGKDSNHRLCT